MSYFIIGKNTEGKPMQTIENLITEKLTGDMQKNALDFVAYMRAAGMENDEANSSAFNYKGQWVCILIIDEGNWTIYDNPLTKHYDDYPVDAKLKQFAWANVHICATGHCDSSPGARKTILGKEFENVCTSEVAFRNPDAKTLKYVMQLTDIWIQSLTK